MTGTLRTIPTSSGKEFFYIHLSYKDPHTQKWRTKDIKTGLAVKGNKRKAEALIKEYLDQYAHLEQLSILPDNLDPDIDLCDYLDLWIAEKECDICGNTVDTYKSRITTIKRYFGPRKIPMRNITPKHLNDFYHYCLKYGRIRQKDNSRQPLSVRTTRSCKSVLYAAFNDAILKGLVTTNPVRDTKVTNKRNKDFSEEMLFLTEEEIREMLLFLGEHYPFLKPIAFIGVYYGLRREEILGLKWSAINHKRRELIIRHTVTGNKTIYRENKTKTKSGYRTLNLFPTAEQCLQQVKREQEENRRFFGDAYQDTEDYVFTHEDGRPYRPDYLTHKFSRAMAEFGRPEITLHKLRYTCASLLIDKGWDVKKVQYWLGDSDAATVMNIYAQYMRLQTNVAENDLTEMSNAVADLFA